MAKSQEPVHTYLVTIRPGVTVKMRLTPSLAARNGGIELPEPTVSTSAVQPANKAVYPQNK